MSSLPRRWEGTHEKELSRNALLSPISNLYVHGLCEAAILGSDWKASEKAII